MFDTTLPQEEDIRPLCPRPTMKPTAWICSLGNSYRKADRRACRSLALSSAVWFRATRPLLEAKPTKPRHARFFSV
jgi:hypothetical protein